MRPRLGSLGDRLGSAFPGGGPAQDVAEEGEPLDGDQDQDSEGVKDRAQEGLAEADDPARRG